MTVARSPRGQKILGVLHRAGASKASARGCLAGRANPFVPIAASAWDVIEERLLPLLEAVSTEVMRGFARTHVSLKGIHNRSSFRASQLVALALCFPCFHASNLAFKVSYSINQRRLRH